MIKTAVSYNILLQKIYSLVTETISEHLKNFISKMAVLKTKGLWEVNLPYAPLTLIITTTKTSAIFKVGLTPSKKMFLFAAMKAL